MLDQEWVRSGSFSVDSCVSTHGRLTSFLFWGSYLQLLTLSQTVHILRIFTGAMEIVQRAVAISSAHFDDIVGFGRHDECRSVAQCMITTLDTPLKKRGRRTTRQKAGK